MTTLTGPWEGHGRIRIEYTRTYENNDTEARFVGSIYIESDVSVSDSNNTWKVESPNFADDNGSNLNISIGSGGGTKKFFDFNFDSRTDAEIYAEVAGVEYFGQTVEHDFTLSVGDLAPFLNNTNYVAGSITSSSFVVSGISGNGNGGTLNNVNVEYNTSASSSGASNATVPGYASSVSVTGLYRATTYYYRVRVQNSTYGWGPFGPWKSVTTLPSAPSGISEAWNIANITQTDALAQGFSVANNGGSALDMWLVRINSSPVDAGATDFTGGGGVTSLPITGLIPGNTYYARLWAHNAYGWAVSATWKSFTALPGVSVNVGGVWKNAQPYVNVGGIWKPAVRYVNVGGIWKQ